MSTPAVTAEVTRRELEWTTVVGYTLSVLGWLGMGLLYVAISQFPEGGLPLAFVVVDVIVGAAMLLAIRWRHRRPWLLAIVFCVLGNFFVSGSVAATWAFVHLCTRRRWREVLSTAGVFITMGFVADVAKRGLGPGASLGTTSTDLPPGYWAIGVLMALVFTAALVAIGFYVGARRDLVVSLRVRAETAEREQELRVLQGQAQERNRIAREMHDVLAHRMSLVSMHAGALAYRDNLTTEQTREIARVIQENAHASLTELRGVLGSLRGDMADDSLPPEKPQPTLADLDDLLAEARSGGQRVVLNLDLPEGQLPPPVISRHAYRVVQEAVTNARKHAPRARLDLHVFGAPETGLTIISRNPLQAGPSMVPGAGVGMVGLQERAQITGGRLAHGVTADRTFELKVWLPW